MLVHTLNCPMTSGEADICTCGATLRAALAEADRGLVDKDAEARKAQSPLFQDWIDDDAVSRLQSVRV